MQFLYLYLGTLLLSGIFHVEAEDITTETSVPFRKPSDCPKNVTCVDCPPGTHADPNLPKCSCCPMSGQCSTINYCSSCEPGYYKTNKTSESQEKCLPCPEGHYRDPSNESSCLSCPKGYFCSKQGCASCSPCAAGSFSNVTGLSACMSCLPGTYTAEEGQSECQSCSAGTYTMITGAKECTVCPAGFYCSCSDCGPVACPETSVCPQGSSKPVSCFAPLFVKQNYKCYLADPVIGIIIGSSVLLVLAIVIIIARVYVKHRRRPSLNESSSLFQEAQTEPVYTGL